MNRNYLKAAFPAAIAGLLALCAIQYSQIDEAQAARDKAAELAERLRVQVRTPVVNVDVAKQPAAAEEHVVHLPNDGGQYYLTVLTSANWRANQRERELLAWFESDPACRSLKAQTHWNHYTPESRLYQSRLAHALPDVPAVSLQAASGKVLYKASGLNLPITPKELIAKVRDCFPRPKPPTPSPQPAPPVEPPLQPIPDLGPPIPDVLPPPADDSPMWLVVVAGLVGAAAGVANEWRKTHGI